MTRFATAVCSALTLIACTSSPEPGSQVQSQAETITVSGRVTVIGSDPHVLLVIVTDDVYYELVGELAEELRELQQRRVTVRGRIVRTASDGPGFPARLKVDKYTPGQPTRMPTHDGGQAPIVPPWSPWAASSTASRVVAPARPSVSAAVGRSRRRWRPGAAPAPGRRAGRAGAPEAPKPPHREWRPSTGRSQRPLRGGRVPAHQHRVHGSVGSWRRCWQHPSWTFTLIRATPPRALVCSVHPRGVSPGGRRSSRAPSESASARRAVVLDEPAERVRDELGAVVRLQGVPATVLPATEALWLTPPSQMSPRPNGTTQGPVEAG